MHKTRLYSIAAKRRMRDKTLFLRDLIIDNKIDVLCLTETWLYENEISKVGKSHLKDFLSNMPQSKMTGEVAFLSSIGPISKSAFMKAKLQLLNPYRVLLDI